MSLPATNTSFGQAAYLGVIMLGGIVVSNAILLVDSTNVLRRRDKVPLRDASTFITLVFVPTVYTLFEEGWSGLWKKHPHEEVAAH